MLLRFSAVRLTTDRYLDEGVGVGAIGFILDVFDGYAVEISRPEDGTTIALHCLKAEGVEPAPEVMAASSERSNVCDRVSS